MIELSYMENIFIFITLNPEAIWTQSFYNAKYTMFLKKGTIRAVED